MCTKLVYFLLSVIILIMGYEGKANNKKLMKKGSGKYAGKCKPNILAEYNLTFYGDWSSTVFPKMYPRYRPPAQWSKLVGRSHDDTYILWSMGNYSSTAVRSFAERGDSALLEQDAQSYHGVFDSFTAAPITSGMGRTSVRVLADGMHSKVSLIVKIVPSPDWFVGIDSVDLCQKKRWKKKLEFDLRPMDAGTDQGMTFTSPNWPTIPAEPIFEINSSYPSHPANSFQYPNMDVLPRLGHVVMHKVVDYRRRGKHVPPAPTGPNVVIYDDSETGSSDGSDVNEDIEVELENTVESLNVGKKAEVNLKESVYDSDHSNAIALQDQAIEETTSAPTTESPYPQDCIVAAWGQWGPCSKTCGYGVQFKTREVAIRPHLGGQACPALTEEKLCGSMRNCKWKHFSNIFRGA